MPEKIITAQVVLYSPHGTSILNEQHLSSSNINMLTPDSAAMQMATDELQKLGFQCTPLYPTLTISGSRSLFEKTFALTFENKTFGQTSYIVPKQKATIPHQLKNVVAAVVFGEPMEPFV